MTATAVIHLITRSAAITGHRQQQKTWSGQLRHHAQLVGLAPRTPNKVKSLQSGRRLDARRWFSPAWGKPAIRGGQVPPRTLETVGNPPHAHRLNAPAGARTPAAGPVLLIAGRQP